METDDIEDNQVSARMSTQCSLLVAAAASIITVIGWFFLRNSSYWQWNTAAVVCILLAVFLNMNRNLPSWANSFIYLTGFVLAILASILTNYELALKGLPFAAFEGFKLVAIAVAIIVPRPVWTAKCIIVTCALAPMIIYYTILPVELRSTFNVQEPWLSLIYAVIASIVLQHRLKAIAWERTLERLKTERRAVVNLAQILLALRDLTNTPIQSIELTSQLLKAGRLSPSAGSHHLELSLLKLRELSVLLTRYEKDIDWTRVDAAFDPVTLIQCKIAEMKLGANSSHETHS